MFSVLLFCLTISILSSTTVDGFTFYSSIAINYKETIPLLLLKLELVDAEETFFSKFGRSVSTLSLFGEAVAYFD